MQRIIGLLVSLLIAITILVIALIVAENFLIHIFVGLAALIIFAYLVLGLADEIETSPSVDSEAGYSERDISRNKKSRRSDVRREPPQQKDYGAPPEVEAPVQRGSNIDNEQEPIPASQDSVEDLIDYYDHSRVDDFVTEEEKSDVPGWVLEPADEDDNQIEDWFPTTTDGVDGLEDEEAEEPEPSVDTTATGEYGLPNEEGPVTGEPPERKGEVGDVSLGDAAPPQPSMPPQDDVNLTRSGGYSGPPLEELYKDTQQVHFAAYYPKEMKPQDWQPLHAYVYKKFVEDKVLNDVRQELGEKMASFRQAGSPSRQEISEGAMIVATPRLDGFQFNPPMVAIGFYKDWHRLDFELRATNAPLYQASNGQIVFTVEGIIVAEIPLSIYVSDQAFSGETQQVTQKIYEAVFASYSHRDTTIVERVERAIKALGLDYLRDVTSLKSGQHWSEELLELIERADIFQLFWSPNAAQSDYVRQEYEHALNVAKDASSFIRPVYWQTPMADPPDGLRHLHFAYQPDLAED